MVIGAPQHMHGLSQSVDNVGAKAAQLVCLCDVNPQQADTKLEKQQQQQQTNELKKLAQYVDWESTHARPPGCIDYRVDAAACDGDENYVSQKHRQSDHQRGQVGSRPAKSINMHTHIEVIINQHTQRLDIRDIAYSPNI